MEKSIPQGPNRLRKKFTGSGEVRGIKIAWAEARIDFIGFIGTTEVVPCYSTRSDGVFRKL